MGSYLPQKTFAACRGGFQTCPYGKSLGTGGGERIRTADPLRAKQALFRLSYTP